LTAGKPGLTPGGKNNPEIIKRCGELLQLSNLRLSRPSTRANLQNGR
jgi:hypothetical protein